MFTSLTFFPDTVYYMLQGDLVKVVSEKND